jgi:putative phosphoserine phosphatase / 1-acylglycerol-3-phosphate O-acyltransferase
MDGIDFYDVDHTLLRGTSGVRFLLTGVRGGVFPLATLVYLPVLLLRYRLGRLDLDVERQMVRPIRDLTKGALDELARKSFIAVRRRIYDDARMLLAERKARGRRAVLATSSLDVIVRPLAEELGVDEVLAASFEAEGERYTGRLGGPPLFGERKMRAVLDYIASSGLDPARCAFFSDSITDLPLLEAVGEPVAVNPDSRLRAVARRRGWPILRWS